MIQKWEPRIEIVDIPITGVEEESTYYIKILFFVPELNAEGTYDLTLEN